MALPQKVIIGSRGSDLALWQANRVKQLLEESGIKSEIKIISTRGDRVQDLSFDKIEGKGFFTKEIEEELLEGKIDLAVHSHKDLPTVSPEGLCIAAVSAREDASDVLLIREERIDEKKLFCLPADAVVGTSSFRRKLLLKAWRIDIDVRDLRGNVPTRVNKLREGNYDAILLAWAGIKRLNLNLDGLRVIKLAHREFPPAPAQGVLAMQTRENDVALIEALQGLNHSSVKSCISLERKVLNLLEGGCQTPLGIICKETRDEDDKLIYDIHLAWASSVKSPAVFMHYQTPVLEPTPDKIVQALRNIKPCRIFITRNQRQGNFFSRILIDAGFVVHASSLIEMRAVKSAEPPDADWVFFSSKHAVDFYLKAGYALKGKKIGAISKATAQMIRQAGFVCDFIGYSTDTALTGKQFAGRVGRSNVVFPIARGSMKTIQKQLPQAQVLDLVVYETINLSKEIPEFDLPVFTSPSNVDAFFQTKPGKIPAHAVAMGGATAARLRHYGVRKIQEPDAFDDLGLIMAVLRLNSGL